MRALVLANTNVIDQHVIRQSLHIDAVAANPSAAKIRHDTFTDLDTAERHYLQRLLQHCNGDKHQAAAIAGISLRSLYRRLEAGL
jgi:DNA-binding NtrC family response regulator